MKIAKILVTCITFLTILHFSPLLSHAEETDSDNISDESTNQSGVVMDKENNCEEPKDELGQSVDNAEINCSEELTSDDNHNSNTANNDKPFLDDPEGENADICEDTDQDKESTDGNEEDDSSSTDDPNANEEDSTPVPDDSDTSTCDEDKPDADNQDEEDNLEGEDNSDDNSQDEEDNLEGEDNSDDNNQDVEDNLEGEDNSDDNSQDEEASLEEDKNSETNNKDEDKPKKDTDDKKDKPVLNKKPNPQFATTAGTMNATVPYKKGDSAAAIATAKKKLNKIGFGGITVTNYFGAFTETRVKQFQKEYGIKQTGTLTQATLNKINEIYTSPLQKGKRHNDLINLKHKLNHLGFGHISVTDYFGDYSEKKVKEFQKGYLLPISGIIDLKTKNKINSIFASTYKEGGRNDKIKDLKRNLNKLGFSGILVTDYYGAYTTKMVKAFQQYYGLTATGNADLNTLKKANTEANSVYQKGKRHNNTAALKKKLNKIGFGNISVTTLYGSFTEKRVKDFQQFYNLRVNGIIDQKTLNKINEIYNSPLQQGKSHSDLTNIKHMLNHLGFGNISVTTFFGNFTESKVKEYQKSYNLPVSGIVDTHTKNHIESTFSSTYQQGGRNEKIKDLKRNLNKIGFGSISVTNYFGTYTEKMVKQFQQYYGLKATGKADINTLLTADEVANTPFQIGVTNKATSTLKQNLNRLGFKGILVTDYYGEYTEKKVKDFQRYYGLRVTGIADPITMDRISEILNSPFQKGKRHNETTTYKKKLNRIGFGNISVTTLFGDFTDKRVRDFQEFYKLIVNGIIDNPTSNHINTIFNSPFQLGKRHDGTIKIKQDLNALGYSGISVTSYFGDFTEKRLKEFQKDYNLPVSGIADAVTIATINLAVKNNTPKVITEYTDYNLTLDQAVDIQMARPIIITDKYRNDPAYISANYVVYTGAAAINGTNVNIRTKPNTTSTIAYQAKNGEKVTIVGTTTGTNVNGSTLWYHFKASNGNKYYVHSSLITGNSGKTTGTVNVRAGTGTGYHIYGQLDKGTNVTIRNNGNNWHEISYTGWRKPKRADLKHYLDPNNNDKFQHLRLDTSINVSAKELNKALAGKGILAGKGQAFINGAKKHQINEAYLISHASLETGNGTSTLANGVEVGKNKQGNLVLVTDSNRKNLTDIKTTYNMFGIGAVDSNPLKGGAITAYKNGWFTPEKAIEGGAAWIGGSYIHNEHKQNTLYKMKWNPNMSSGYAWKQYATDIAWATKQLSNIKQIYDLLHNPTYHFDIARY